MKTNNKIFYEIDSLIAKFRTINDGKITIYDILDERKKILEISIKCVNTDLYKCYDEYVKMLIDLFDKNSYSIDEKIMKAFANFDHFLNHNSETIYAPFVAITSFPVISYFIEKKFEQYDKSVVN